MRVSGFLTSAQREILADLHERDRGEREAGIREARSLKALAPVAAELLHLLVLQKGAQKVVEFGTSHGYSTIHLAAAVERTGGHVFSVDAMPEKAALAGSNLTAAGLEHRVSLTVADGSDFVRSLPDGIDLVLVDYGIPAFTPAFAALRDRMAPGCLLFVDGGPPDYWSTGAGASFRALLEEDPSFVVSILPMHRDELIAVRVPQ